MRGLAADFAASADNDRAGLHIRFADKHILCSNNIRSVNSFNRRNQRLRASSDDHSIRFLCCQQRFCDRGSRLYRNLHILKVLAQRRNECRKLTFSGRICGRAELPSKMPACFVNRHIVTDLCCGFRCHQSGRAAADYHNFLRRICTVHRILVLASHAGIHQAGCAGTCKQPCFASLQTSDAVADIFKLAFLCLVGKMRIRKRTSAHSDEVGLSHDQNSVGHLCIIDPVRNDDRAGNQFFDLLCRIHIESVLGIHWSNDLAENGRSVHSVGYMDRVYAKLVKMTD